MEVRRRPGSIPASSSSLAYQDELEKVSRHRGLGGDIAKRARLLNVLSLEFSMSPLGEKVLSPALVRAVDWVELYWPKELRCVDDSSDDLTPFFPKVQQCVSLPILTKLDKT
uniref:Uncharacterized protein n=1 Tax=Ascaris lumbricoides TaxID=6252 RepID=A0A0M3HKG7_ASCLU